VPEDKKTAAAKVEAEAAQTGPPDDYAPQRLIDEASARFGVGPHVAAGAFAESDAETLTIADAQGLIDVFLPREIVRDNPIQHQPEGEEG